MVFLHALSGVFGLIIMGLVGYVLAARGWFGAETRILLPRLVTCVALPPFLMYTIMHSFQREALPGLARGALLPLAAIAVTFVLACALGRLLRVPHKHFGLFCASISNPNTVFVGIPVNLALFGEEALPYALVYYCAGTVFFWTIGQYAVVHDQENSKGPLSARTLLLQIFSPPLLGFLLGVALTLCGVTLPTSVQDAARYLGGLTTPLALIFIGISIFDIGLRGLRLERDLVVVLLGRLVGGPLIMLAFLHFFPVPALMGKVFVVQSSLPVMMQAAILSAHYHTDSRFGALAVTLSTLLSVVTIPLYMTLLSALL